MKKRKDKLKVKENKRSEKDEISGGKDGNLKKQKGRGMWRKMESRKKMKKGGGGEN